MTHHYQCWSKLQDHSNDTMIIRDYHTISIIQLSLTAFKTSLPPAFIFLTFLSSPKQGPHRAAFPFSCTAQAQVQKLSIRSPLQCHRPSHLCCPSLPHLLTLLCISSQNLSALMCSFTPSLTVQAWHHLSLYSVLPLSEAIFPQNNPNSFLICLCFTFLICSTSSQSKRFLLKKTQH